MYWLVSLLVLETATEGLLCNGMVASRKLNIVACGAAAIMQTGLLVWLAVLDWQVWVWLLPLAAYRGINMARTAVRRLPQPHLNSVSLRAFRWLVIGQAFAVFAALLIVRYKAGLLAFNILVAAQLLCAFILLRASTHTWRHAYASAHITPLTDKELPTLSVLIPARNETESLHNCLEALLASDYPKLEVIVLDDSSNDRRTPDIIRSFAHEGVRFIPGDLPDENRWLAKNFAYAQLAHEASGELLLFCGVDAVFEPQSLRQLVGQLTARQKDMLSVMPLRARTSDGHTSLLQTMRYYWEISLPRRFFKRPPVLSTCWLIKADTLKRMGGFESVSRSVNPEAPLARQAVVTDSYGFIRSDETVGVYSTKPASEQYGTSVRVRYPQLHRRLELVALASLFEFVFLLGPLVSLLLVWLLPHEMAYAAIWAVATLCIFTAYGLIAVGARLTNGWIGWLLMPVAFVVDFAMLHISLWKYEFGEVEWKGRNVVVPVMQVIPRLPKLPSSPVDSE